MKRRRGRFSCKEHRKLMSMIAAGASVDQMAAKFKTSREMIVQKASEFGHPLKDPLSPSRRMGAAATGGQLLVVKLRNGRNIAVGFGRL